MANEVYANGREIACKAASGKTTAAFPDTCLSPPSPPAGPVPVPYPNTACAKDTTKGSTTVMISGQEVMLKDQSTFKTSSGNEAATRSLGMGVVTHTIQGEASFVAWSMDVKIEGQNVDRHLDMTVHNEQCLPAETPPWPYIDNAATGGTSPCNKEPDNDYAAQVAKNCTDPKDHPEQCKTDDCCNCKGRKCMLVHGGLGPKNECCGSQTPHHIIPVMDHYDRPGIRQKKLAPAARQQYLQAGSKTYNEDAAPAICVDGKGHELGKQHGRIGRAFAFLRNKHLSESGASTYKYADVAEPAAQVVSYVTECDSECIKTQMDNYHNTHSSGPLRRSRQAVRGGEEEYEDALADSW
jgi:hypothetical protein